WPGGPNGMATCVCALGGWSGGTAAFGFFASARAGAARSNTVTATVRRPRRSASNARRLVSFLRALTGCPTPGTDIVGHLVNTNLKGVSAKWRQDSRLFAGEVGYLSSRAHFWSSAGLLGSAFCRHLVYFWSASALGPEAPEPADPD